MKRQPDISMDTLGYLLVILNAIDVDEGMKSALELAAENRRIRGLAKKSRVHENTLRRYQRGASDIYLGNAIDILKAMGLRLTVKPI